MTEQDNLREMVKVLIVDELARRQESEDSEVLSEIESLTRCQCDICDTVPEVLREYGVTLNAGIEELLPDMKKLVEEIDARWAGKLTLAELGEEFGDWVYTTSALSAVGHGVSLSDEREVEDYIEARGCKVLHDVYVSDTAVFNAASLIEEAVFNATNKEQGA